MTRLAFAFVTPTFDRDRDRGRIGYRESANRATPPRPLSQRTHLLCFPKRRTDRSAKRKPGPELGSTVSTAIVSSSSSTSISFRCARRLRFGLPLRRRSRRFTRKEKAKASVSDCRVSAQGDVPRFPRISPATTIEIGETDSTSEFTGKSAPDWRANSDQGCG